MKIKKLNIIMFLFLLLIVVGLSPPYKDLNINNSQSTVYAVQTSENTGHTYGRYDAKFANSVDAYITKYNLFKDRQDMKDELINNLDASIGRFNDYLDIIVNSTKVLMTSLCVLTIAIIGFKYMNSGTGNLVDFIKSKEKLANTALAMVFVLAIPTLINGINGISVQVYSGGNKLSSYGNLGDANYILSLDNVSGSQKIENVFVTPSSYMVKIYSDNFFSQKTNFQGEFSSGGEDDDARFLSTGGFLKMIERFLLFLLKFIYMPFHFIINIIGIIGFYPMSFDPAMYDETIVTAVVNQLHGFSENTILKSLGLNESTITKDIVTTVAGAFQSVIIVINLIAGILKKICLATVDFACYFFGLKVLIGVETTKVKDFLYRLLQGVLGMFAAPFIVQTLIDVDAIISAGILGLVGNALPGIGMMNLIMVPSQASYSLLNFIFAVAMLSLMVFIVQAFFFRRIELIMYYLAAPAVFLKHIFEPRPKIVMMWLGQVASASFVTTTYAPLFVTVNFLIKLGGALKGLDLLLYYAIIWFIIFKGKDVTLWLTDLFFGGKSFSDTMMRSKMQEGLEFTKNLPMNGVRAAGKVHGLINSTKEALTAEQKNGGGAGSLIMKTAKGALVSNMLKSVTDTYTDGFSSGKENNWYNNHLKQKEARYDTIQKAGLGGMSVHAKDENAEELASRHRTLAERKHDGENYNNAYKKIAEENPNMDRNSDEFRKKVNELYQSKGLNNEDKVNYSKGRTALDKIFASNEDEYLKLSENSLIDETIKNNLISSFAKAEGINTKDDAAMDKFKQKFYSSFEGKQIVEMEKASEDFIKAMADYEAETKKPPHKRDDNVCLDALKIMDKSKEIMGQSPDVEKMIRTQIVTATAETKLKAVEIDIKKDSSALANTITQISKVEVQMKNLKPDDEDFAKISAQLSSQMASLQQEKATHEANRNIKINTRGNLEQKINTNRDALRQDATVVATRSNSIERKYNNSEYKSTSEKAYRQEVGEHTYSKVRIEKAIDKVTDSNGKTITDSSGKPVMREIKVKRDVSGNVRTDSNGMAIDYSDKNSQNYKNHQEEIRVLNEGISEVKAQARYESKTASNKENKGASTKKDSNMDKVFRENMREHAIKGTFHNHNDDNQPMY